MSGRRIKKHISTIRVGDTVVCPDGVERTVGKDNLKIGGFCGTTLWGDSYRLGLDPVTVVDFARRK